MRHPHLLTHRVFTFSILQFLDLLEEGATRQVFYDGVDELARDEDVVELDYVGVVEDAQGADFVFEGVLEYGGEVPGTFWGSFAC